MKCPSCKKMNNEGVKFCKYCGSPMLGGYSTCPNGHNYESHLPKCPFCPSTDYEKTMMESDSKISSPVAGKGREDKTIVDTSSPTLKASNDSAERSDKTVIYGIDKGGDLSENGELKVSSGRKLVGWLVTYDINSFGTDYRLFEGRSKIGRSAKNDIIVNQQGISEEHTIILYRENKFYIQDNLSTNGTYVNGVSIDEKLVLKNDDLIKLGNVSFKLKII